MFKYFVHCNTDGEVVGYDMAPLTVNIETFCLHNYPSITTTEVTKEEFEQVVSRYKEIKEQSI